MKIRQVKKNGRLLIALENFYGSSVIATDAMQNLSFTTAMMVFVLRNLRLHSVPALYGCRAIVKRQP